MCTFRTLVGLALAVLISACGVSDEPIDESTAEEDVQVIVTFDHETNGVPGPNFDDDDSSGPASDPEEPDPEDPDPEPDPQPDPDPEPEPETPPPNDGWIGGACEATSDCDYDDAICLQSSHPAGQCSLACDGICPDRDGENSVTFCIEKSGGGRCVSMCDPELYPGDGCRDGYFCRTRERFGDSSVSAEVCVPDVDEPDPDPELSCLDQLTQLGVDYHSWGYQTQYADGLACTVGDPIFVQSPINGVTYRYFNQSSAGEMRMGCELALALHELGEILDDYDIVEVEHIGTFNCRKISGTQYLSAHGLGLAIDFYGFIDSSGNDYVLERDWEHGTSNPQNPKAQVLHEIGTRMYNEGIFNIVLTPNFNAGHDNHFHVDLTPGGNYFMTYASPYELGTGCGN